MSSIEAAGEKNGFRGYIRVNETAKDILELLNEETDRDGIIANLIKKYPEAAKEKIEESVDETVEKLSAAGLLI